jgi:hypothetical protein
MSNRYWWADKYHMRDTVDETLNHIMGNTYEGQMRMETFEGYETLPMLMIMAATAACRETFGDKFTTLHERRGDDLQVFLHRPRRDERDEGLVELGLSFSPQVSGFIHRWDTDSGRFVEAFDRIFKVLKSRVTGRFPEATCYMTHSGRTQLNFSVLLAPKMPMRIAA